MNNLIAQDTIPLHPDGGFQGFGPLGNPTDAPGLFNQVISTIIGVMTVIAFIWFVFLFFTGAIALMTSGGDKGKIEEARAKLTSGVVGLVVVIAAIFLIDLLGKLLGVEVLNPGAFLQNLPF